jgi:hypothetical protein
MIGRALEALEAAAGELPPDIVVERLEDGIRLSGRGLLRRWAGDARLHRLVAEAERRLR